MRQNEDAVPTAVIVERGHHVKAAVTGENRQSLPLVGAMFDDGHAVPREKCGEARNNPAIAGVSVHAAIEGHTGLMQGDFRIKSGHVVARHVRRIGDDKIECRIKGRGPVPAHDPGAVADPMAARVAGRHGTGPLTDVDAKARAGGPRHQERDKETSRSGAKIKDACRRMVREAAKTELDQCLAVRTRGQGVRRDLEVEAPEFATPGNLREGLSPRPPGDEGGETAVLPGRKGLRLVAAEGKPRQKPGLPRRMFDTGGAQSCGRSPAGRLRGWPPARQ